jgi:CheY-like chemotaxis protein
MDRQICILVIDDLQEWREQITRALRWGGFLVDAVSTPAEALERLEVTLYHVLILDICMDETDLRNIDGIELLKQLYHQKVTESIKIIMLTGHGTEQQMYESFRDYKVEDFLSKSHFNRQIIIEAVQRLFTKNADINLALKIIWQQSDSRQAVLDLKIGGNRIKGQLQTQVAEELEDLLCRLFKDADSVLVRPLIPGYSGAAVLAVQPFYETVGTGRLFVVKFGDVKQVEREHENFKKYVQPFLEGGRNATVIDVRYTPHLGGIIYSFLGTNQNKLIDFGEFYRQAKLPQITKVLDRLFSDTCCSWYANPQGLRPVNLTDDYQRLLSYSAEKLEQMRLNQLKAIQGRQKLSFKALKETRVFTNPILAVQDRKFVYSTYLCTTHGDFNPHNLLVDATGHVWLIDFQSTGPSHILRDITMLDATIRFQLLDDQNVTLDECLQMEEVLCRSKRFSEIERLPSKLETENPALAKTYSAILHLYKIARKLVSQNPSDDMSEYYIALLYNALSATRFSTLLIEQREHAMLCASLLAERLGLSS